MKRYKIYPSYFSLFFSIVWIAISSGILFFIANSQMTNEEGEEVSSLPAFIFLGIFVAVGLGLLISDLIYFSRRSAALKGEPGIGELVEFHLDYSSNSEGGSSVLGFAVSFTYTMADGRPAMTSTRIPLRYSVYFQNRRQVPIRSNGKYAFYDLEALKMDIASNGATGNMADSMRSAFNDYSAMSGMGVPPFTGNMMNQTSSGDSRYCPKCGKPVTTEDTFCRSCGNKL